MKIALGCDHGGLEIKNAIIEDLKNKGVECIDFGTTTTDSVDYPVYAKKVCAAVQSGECVLGILCCGTGIGMSIAANKIPGIRAAAVSDCFTAKATRQHNDSNILCLGERTVGPGLALLLMETFLTTEFEGGRHQTRVDMISALEK